MSSQASLSSARSVPLEQTNVSVTARGRTVTILHVPRPALYGPEQQALLQPVSLSDRKAAASGLNTPR